MSVRKRKKSKKNNSNKSKSSKSNKSQNATKQSPSKSIHSKKNKQVPVIPLPLLFRLLIASMFLLSIYLFKRFYLPKPESNANTNTTTETTPNNNSITIDNTINMTKIINSNDLDLTKTKLKEISSRFSKKNFGKKTHKNKLLPALRLWNINDFWTSEMALNISNQLYSEFMDEIQRNKSFYFVVNKGNEKIRGNDNIDLKTKSANELLENNRFAYCKYEYRRQLPLYKRILSYLNSSYVTNIMSKILKKNIVGVSDLFVSIYYKGNFLSIHDDRGLGHYAFVNFLSQDWDSDKYGGSLNFNCQDRYKWKDSCYELKPKFNQQFMFKVWPESVQHFVKQVIVDKPRIAITGWYF
eukprot:12299_1